MPVSDFECQIARGQIGRYLGGGALSSEAMTGLEEHLGECPDCKALVAERRAALMGMLDSDAPTQAVVSMPIENPLVAALRAKAESGEPAEKAVPKAKAAPRYAKASVPKKTFGKPLTLAALLAVVLVGMSYVSRMTRGQGTLGQKAAASFAKETIPDTPLASRPSIAKLAPVAPASTPAPMPKPLAPKPVAKKAPPKATVRPGVEKAPIVPATKPIPRKPLAKGVAKPIQARKRAIRRIVRKSSVRRKAVVRTSVRVYGLDGRPLKP